MDSQKGSSSSSRVSMAAASCAILLLLPYMVVALTCQERGYTLCPDACCGRNSTSGEAMCCLESSAVCCNRPALAEGGNRFFCCPAWLPVCDFDAGTCRASVFSPRPTAQAAAKHLADLYRALRPKPGHDFRGHSFAAASAVLNKHLRRNVEQHGHSADAVLKPCSQVSAQELYVLQKRVLDLRAAHMNNHYKHKRDRRRLRLEERQDFEDDWMGVRRILEERPHMTEAILSGYCHESVMWYTHHLHNAQQKVLLDEPITIPYLPDVQFFQQDGDESTGSEPVEQGNVPLDSARRVYIVQTGCGACHVSNRTSMPLNATQCPAPGPSPSDLCMVVDQLLCNSSSEHPQYQCCAGLRCEPIYIPASELTFSLNTTRCTVPAEIESVFRQPPRDEKQKPDNVSGRDENAVKQPRTALPNAPILPASWTANGTYYNLTADDPTQPAGTTRFMYQENGLNNLSTVRVDFDPVCPFKQLWKRGLAANYGPCSVLFRNNTVTYEYRGQHTCTYCSEDSVTAWHRDFPCRAGSLLNANVSIALLGANRTVRADEWQFEWWVTNFLTLRNYRNWYFLPGTTTPVRVGEDLDTGYTDLEGFTEVPPPGLSDAQLTEGLLQNGNVSYVAGLHGTRPCTGIDERQTVAKGDLPECLFVHGIYTRRTWPQREWPPVG